MVKSAVIKPTTLASNSKTRTKSPLVMPNARSTPISRALEIVASVIRLT